MELKLFGLFGAQDRRNADDEGEFVLELTVDELVRVAGGHDDESPKETMVRR